MTNPNETIADICREMHEQAQTWWGRKVPNFCDLHDTWAITADRILAAAKRTIYTDNTETLRNALTRIDELTKERDRLRAALNPVMECDLGSPNQMAAWGAVREAQRIYMEGANND